MATTDSTSPSEPNKNGKSTPKRLIAKQESKLKEQAKRVAASWKASKLTLVWKTAADFEKEVSSYETLLDQKAAVSGSRQPVTLQLQTLEGELKKAIKELKVFLEYKKGSDNAKSYFRMFGLTNTGTLPTNQAARVQSMQLLIENLSKEPVQPDTHTVDFWKASLKKYKELLEDADTKDSTITEKVQDKKGLNQEINRTLRSLTKLLEANYPSNYKDMLQKWGF